MSEEILGSYEGRDDDLEMREIKEIKTICPECGEERIFYPFIYEGCGLYTKPRRDVLCKCQRAVVEALVTKMLEEYKQICAQKNTPA